MYRARLMLFVAVLCGASAVRAEHVTPPGPQAAPPPQDTGYRNQVAVNVNTQPISVREIEALFQDRFVLILERIRSGKLDLEKYPQEVRAAWDESIQSAIQDELIDQLGRKERSAIISSYVNHASPGVPPDRRLEKFKRLEADELRRLKEHLLETAGGRAALEEALKQQGKSYDQWEAGLRKELFRRVVLSHSMGGVRVAPRMAKQYYEDHPDEFTNPETWALRRIRIPYDKFQSRESAEKAAQFIHEKLKEGEDFARTAARLDYDPAFGTNGGLLMVGEKTVWEAGHFPAEEAIARKLETNGAFSAPTPTADAILIVQRVQHNPAKKFPFEAVANHVSSLVYGEQIKLQKKAFFEKMEARSFIKILDKNPPAFYLKIDPRQFVQKK